MRHPTTEEMQVEQMCVNGVDLAYVEEGKGETLVFVHGSAGDWRNWEGLRRSIAEKYYFVSLSLRYHYPNAWADDWQELFDEAQVEAWRHLSARSMPAKCISSATLPWSGGGIRGAVIPRVAAQRRHGRTQYHRADLRRGKGGGWRDTKKSGENTGGREGGRCEASGHAVVGRRF